ncbi:MAG TPA: sigma-70 family RNA polymerase sigma factor [Acidimicrobiales bacterium]|nr:sigma-70 family RNA polymerase sigma factor [Acidimicrobiales bacterium]
MDERDWLADRFQENRAHLRSVAYRMLGSLSEADDAVQDAWIRVSRADTSDVENLGGWLTTVVAHVCLNMLRSRASRGEELAGTYMPDPIVVLGDNVDPERQALLVESVGLALLVVLQTLAPAERVAFVLHDMFNVPFKDIARTVGRSSQAARQLASRARRRVQKAVSVPDADLSGQREVVDAFFAAARGGDFDALVALLDPDVVLHSDNRVVRGAANVADGALTFADPRRLLRRALVNGAAGVLVTLDGRTVAIMGFTVVNRQIVMIYSIGDPDHLIRLGVTAIGD